MPLLRKDDGCKTLVIMKKVLSFLAAVILLSSCDFTDHSYDVSTYTNGITKQKVSEHVYKMTVEGHEYLMFEGHSVGYGTPISVVHSASCPCSR